MAGRSTGDKEVEEYHRTEIVPGLTPEDKRKFLEIHLATGLPGMALAQVLGAEETSKHTALAIDLLNKDEFVKTLFGQVQHIVANDMTAGKADSAAILADIRERSMLMERPNAAVSAEVARGKMLGYYDTADERSARVMKILSVESLSDDQLGQVISEMQKLPRDIRKSLSLMIYDPAAEGEIEGEAFELPPI